MKRKKLTPLNRDRNRERAYLWGQAARLNDKPETACPNLLPLYGEDYGTVLCDAWMRGWLDKDNLLQMQTRHALKGAD